MSQETVTVARQLWELFDRRWASGEEGVMAGVHPDIEYMEDARWPGAGVYRGVEAVSARFEEYREILGTVDMTLTKIIDAGSEVLVLFETRGESVATGLPFEHKWAYVWSFRDEQLICWRAFFDRDDALRATGLEG